jgi:hypothetical protein
MLRSSSGRVLVRYLDPCYDERKDPLHVFMNASLITVLKVASCFGNLIYTEFRPVAITFLGRIRGKK